MTPGFIATDPTLPLRGNADNNAELMAQTPMHRWGAPEVALYICCDAAAFMTGNDALMDGGWCAQ